MESRFPEIQAAALPSHSARRRGGTDLQEMAEAHQLRTLGKNRRRTERPLRLRDAEGETGKLSSDDIKELEKLVNEKDAVLCKIQRIIPQLDLSTILGSQHITSIEDIINRPPLDTLKEAFAIRHNAPMNERQEKMLSDLLTTSSL